MVLIGVCFAATAFVLLTTAASAQPQPLDLGDRLELFVDGYLVDRMTGVTRVLHPPERREVAIVYDAPWEGKASHYVTVFQDGATYRMYYRGLPLVNFDNEQAGPEVTCYAESADGIHWTKPKLGLCESQGSKENNIVWTGAGAHNFAAFKDANPNCPADQQYKAVAGGPLLALASPDGLHWRRLQDAPIITEGAFDSQNLAFWDSVRGEYRAYIRDFADGVRTIRTCTSPDFLHWTKPEWVRYGDAPPEHLYTNGTTPYFRAPQIFVAFPKRFLPQRTKHTELPPNFAGLSEGVFMSTRDGANFDRSFMEAWIRPGLDPNNWWQRTNGPAWGVVQTGPGELSVYWVEHYENPKLDCQLRRGTLRLDGFVSVNAPYAGGELVTKPLRFTGSKLVLNYATSAAGSVQVEIQDAAGNPVEGFALAQCPEIYGDETERAVTWTGGPDVSKLAGQPVRLRFVMKDADLYSIRFRL
jgi:hypothetical protein